MDQDKLKQALIGYGLDEKETKVYLALLELGVASGQEISQKSEVIRTTTYSLLKSLERKNLVTEIQKGRIKHYTIENPKKIIEEMSEREKLIKEVGGDLLALYQSAEHRPLARFYRGLDGIKQIYEMILKEKNLKEYDILSAESDWLKMDEKYFNKFLQRRADRGIKTRLIVDYNAKGLSHQKRNEELKREVKFLSKNYQEAFGSGVYILPRKVIFIAQKQELVAVMVESMEIVQAQRFMFNFIWNNLKNH